MRALKRGDRPTRWAVVSGLCLAALLCVTLAYGGWRSRHAQQLEQTLDSLTYSHAARLEEASQLLEFREIQGLSAREKTAYYTALTRLYGMVIGLDQQSIDSFTNGMTWAERCEDWASAAWLHADIAHLYIKNSSMSTAMTSLNRSLEYAKRTEMPEEYYAYCYSTLAFVHASADGGNLRASKQYYAQAEEYRDVKWIEDYSFSALLDMTQALISLREFNYDQCVEKLAQVRQYMESCDFQPSRQDMYNQAGQPWISRFFLPYYRTAIVVAVEQGRAEDALRLLQESYDFLEENYENTNFTMRLLSGILPAILTSEHMDNGAYEELIDFASAAAVRYSVMMEAIESVAGDRLFQVSNSAVMRLNEEYHVTQLYRIILSILLAAAVGFAVMYVVMKMLRHRADRDGLTGAYNRACFDRHYLAMCQKKKPFGIILYDIDYFKHFNDNHGHAFGDEVLEHVAHTVSALLKPHHAALYRYGGDEFVVISEKCTPASLLDLAQQCEDAVMAVELKKDVHVSLSIGTAHSSQTEDVMKLADDYVYQAKDAGRACVRGSAE